MSAPFMVTVIPGVNRVKVGETATFECIASRDVDVEQYFWVGSEKIAKEERFSYDGMKKFLHVNNVKSYDNNTWVDCTATAVGGRQMTASGRIWALMADGHGESNGDMSHHNGTMTETSIDDIPYLTPGGAVLIAFLFIATACAMFAALWWLKRMEIQKQRDVEASRSRYSRIESGPASPRACYNRDVENVMFPQHGQNDEDMENDDSYEDMLPVVPKRVTGQSPRGSPGGSSGNSKYVPPPRN